MQPAQPVAKATTGQAIADAAASGIGPAPDPASASRATDVAFPVPSAAEEAPTPASPAGQVDAPKTPDVPQGAGPMHSLPDAGEFRREGSAAPDLSGLTLPGAPESRGVAAPAPGAVQNGMTQAEAKPIAGQLAAAITAHPSGGAIELTLAPEELGRVRMIIHHDAQVMSVAIHADRPETLELMRRHSDLLAQEFRAQGFGGAAFSFSGGEGGAAERRPAWAGNGAGAGPEARETLTRPAAPPPAARRSAEGMDLRL